MAESVQLKKLHRKVSEYFVGILQEKKKPIYYEVLRSYVSSAPEDVRNHVKKHCRGEELLSFFRRRSNYFTVDLENKVSWKSGEGVKSGELSHKVGQLQSAEDFQRERDRFHLQHESKQQLRCASVWSCSLSSSSSTSSLNHIETEDAILNYFIEQVDSCASCLKLSDLNLRDLPKYVAAYLKERYTSDKIRRFLLDHCETFYVNDDGYVFLLSKHELTAASKENEDANSNFPVLNKNNLHAPKKKKRKAHDKASDQNIQVPLSRSELYTVKFFIGILENKNGSALSIDRLKGHLSQAVVEVHNFIKLNKYDKCFKKFFTRYPKIFKLTGNDVTLTKTYASHLIEMENSYDKVIGKFSDPLVDDKPGSETKELLEYNLRPHGTTAKLIDSSSNKQERFKENCVTVDYKGGKTLHHVLSKGEQNICKLSCSNVQIHNELNTCSDHSVSDSSFSRRMSYDGSAKATSTTCVKNDQNPESFMEKFAKTGIRSSTSNSSLIETFLSCESFPTDGFSESSGRYYSPERDLGSPVSCESALQKETTTPVNDEMLISGPGDELKLSLKPTQNNSKGKTEGSSLSKGSSLDALESYYCNDNIASKVLPVDTKLPDVSLKFIKQMKESGLFDLYHDTLGLEEDLKLQIGCFLWSLELFCLEHILIEEHLDRISVEYFITQLVDFSEIHISNLKGKLGQAPAEVSAYLNRKFPSTSFINFFLQHKEFSVSKDKVQLLKSPKNSSTILQKPSELYYSDIFVNLYYCILKTMMKLILLLRTKQQLSLKKLASLVDDEQKDILKVFQGSTYIERLKSYFSLFSGLFTIDNQEVKVTPNAALYLQLAIEIALLGRFCFLLRNHKFETNDKAAMEKCLNTALNDFPIELSELSKLKDLHLKVLQKCDGNFIYLFNYQCNIILNNFKESSGEQFLQQLKSKCLSDISQILASNDEGLPYSKIPLLLCKHKSACSLLSVCLPGFILLEVKSEMFECRNGKLHSGRSTSHKQVLSMSDRTLSGKTLESSEKKVEVKLETNTKSQLFNVTCVLAESSNEISKDVLQNESDHSFNSMKRAKSVNPMEEERNCSKVESSEEERGIDSGSEFKSLNDVGVVAESNNETSGKNSCDKPDQLCNNMESVELENHMDEEISSSEMRHSTLPNNSISNSDGSDIESELELDCNNDICFSEAPQCNLTIKAINVDMGTVVNDNHEEKVANCLFVTTIIYDRNSDNQDYYDVVSNILSCYSRFVCENVYGPNETTSHTFVEKQGNIDADCLCDVPAVVNINFDAESNKDQDLVTQVMETTNELSYKNGFVANNCCEAESNDHIELRIETDKNQLDKSSLDPDDQILLKSVSHIDEKNICQVEPNMFFTKSENTDSFERDASSGKESDVFPYCKNDFHSSDTGKEQSFNNAKVDFQQTASCIDLNTMNDFAASYIEEETKEAEIYVESSDVLDFKSTIAVHLEDVEHEASYDECNLNGVGSQVHEEPACSQEISCVVKNLDVSTELEACTNTGDGYKQFENSEAEEHLSQGENNTGTLKQFCEPIAKKEEPTCDDESYYEQELIKECNKDDVGHQFLGKCEYKIKQLSESILGGNQEVEVDCSVSRTPNSSCDEEFDKSEDSVRSKTFESAESESQKQLLQPYRKNIVDNIEHDGRNYQEKNEIEDSSANTETFRCDVNGEESRSFSLTDNEEDLPRNTTKINKTFKFDMKRNPGISTKKKKHEIIAPILQSKRTTIYKNKVNELPLEKHDAKQEHTHFSTKQEHTHFSTKQEHTHFAAKQEHTYFARIVLLSKETYIAEISTEGFQRLVYCTSKCFQCQTHDNCGEASQVLSVGDLVRCSIISPDLEDTMWIAKHFTNISPHKMLPPCNSSDNLKQVKHCQASCEASCQTAACSEQCLKKHDFGVQATSQCADASTQTISSGPILHSSYLPW